MVILMVLPQVRAQELDEFDFSERVELPDDLSEQLKDINDIDSTFLVSLQILNKAEVEAILIFLEAHDNIVSVWELQHVKGVRQEVLRALIYSLRNLPEQGINEDSSMGGYSFIRWSLRELEDKKSQASYLSRSRVIWGGGNSAGLTFEHDRGEPFRNNREKLRGPDFVSGFIALRLKGSRILLGDSRIKGGHGLLFGSGLSLGPGSQVIKSSYSWQIGASPYGSSTEFGFFRGIVFEANLFNRWSIISLAGHKRADATIYWDDYGNRYFKTFKTSGDHRSENSRLTRKNLGVGDFGFLLNRATKGGSAGIGVISSHFEIPLLLSEKGVMVRNVLSKHLLHYSLFWDHTFGNILWYSELASRSPGGHSFVSGLIWSPDRQWDVSLLFRELRPGSRGLYSDAFARGNGENERGFYFGISYKLKKKSRVEFFMDTHESLLPKETGEWKDLGYRWQLNSTFSPVRGIAVKYRLRYTSDHQIRFQEVFSDNRIDFIADMTINVSEQLTYRTRFQGSRTSAMKEKGLLGLQELIWKSGGTKLCLRAVFFHSDTAATRQYVQELEPEYAFSIPSFAGEGVRGYIFLKQDFGKRYTLWVKLGLIEKAPSKISDKLEVNKSRDMKIQLRYKF